MRSPTLAIIGATPVSYELIERLVQLHPEIRIRLYTAMGHAFYVQHALDGLFAPRVGVCRPLDGISHHHQVTVDSTKITHIDWRAQEVWTTPDQSFSFDQLIFIDDDHRMGDFGFYHLYTGHGYWLFLDELQRRLQGLADDQRSSIHFQVIGGSELAVMLAGRLAYALRQLRPSQLVSIQLVAEEGILPQWHTSAREVISAGLRELGVEFTSTSKSSRSSHVLRLLTAPLLLDFPAYLPPSYRDRAGRVVVDGHLRWQGHPNFWVGGAWAATTDQGTLAIDRAQTAHLASAITAVLRNQPLPYYELRGAHGPLFLSPDHVFYQHGSRFFDGPLARWAGRAQVMRDHLRHSQRRFSRVESCHQCRSHRRTLGLTT